MEDGEMIESQQRVIEKLANPQMLVIAADAGLMQMRRIMDRMISAENASLDQTTEV
jgi:hypothetical protein